MHFSALQSVVGELNIETVTVMLHPLTATYYDPDRKIWSGPQRKDVYNENITLGEVIYATLSKHPQKIIQIHDVSGVKLTCAELLHKAKALARNLLKLDLKVGDVIVLYASNWTHSTTLMLASFLCGTPVNALCPAFDKENVALIYKITRPKLIFCDAANYQIAQEVNRELNLDAVVFIMNDNEGVKGLGHIKDLLNAKGSRDEQYFRYPCYDLKGDDTAIIICSSGTTGTPKGVRCSHRAFLNQNVFLTLKTDSVICSFSTLYWISGAFALISSLTTACLRVVTSQAYSPEYFLDLVRRYKITHFLGGGNFMAELIMYAKEEVIQKSLESIDTMLIGGAKVLQAVQEKMNSILACNSQRPGFCVAYGMSELSGMLSISGGHVMERLEGSEGKLVANKQVRIIDKLGRNLGPNEHGEICILTPYTWSGYYQNPEATSKALRSNWLHTGDIGYFNDEGFLHVCARDNDVFKSRNFQIYPQLIEEVICRIPGIAECCVFGIPDFVASHLTACAVVRTQNADGLKLTTKEIDQHVKANMGSMYHLSGGVYFVEAIPKTGSGKAQRRKVLDLVMKIKKEGGEEKP
ncbi:uncharacterized protein LOC101887963 [Musca domestica]|uniref:4-coumarate--CoA ligase-like 7 n=1 Tax=Musca domestica TaxID=7370 RepID=A0A1I8MGY6_MUSDO|nr:uncharacterized protein LOC101887963 [Musca domestica]